MLLRTADEALIRSRSWYRSASVWAALILALASALPVLMAPHTEMIDFPAHMARYAVMLDHGANPWFARYYSFDWKWTGNLGVDLLIFPFAKMFGLETGAKIIVALVPPLTGIGIVWSEWALRRRIGVGTLLGLSFIWSPMLNLGLVNYALGQALALIFFAAWVEMGPRGAWQRAMDWRWLLLLVAGFAVWVSHISAWAVLIVMVAGADFSQRLDEGWRRWWRPALTSLPMFAPIIVMVLIPGTSSDNSYGRFWWLYKTSTWERAMRDSNWWLDHISLGVMGAVIALAVLFSALSWALKRWRGGWGFLDGRFWIDGRLGWAGLGLIILSWVVPRHISGGDLADYRLITTGLMVCVMAIDWCAPWWVLSGPVGLYAVRLATTTLSWQQDSADTDEILKALDVIPEGAKVASVVLTPREFWWFNKQEHVGGYLVIRRHALVNMNFALPHIHMLHVKEGGPGFADPSHRLLQSIHQPVRLDCIRPAYHADWLLYVGAKAPETLPDKAKVVWQGRGVWLARLPNTGVVPDRCSKPRLPDSPAQRAIDRKLSHMPDLKLEGSPYQRGMHDAN
ncbi:hypothetical protein [Novosphingobium rosa]|uniref:hypothetical protein n=1 Tax=Novosphingobium rosa TaxID=76978 RepID=UPI000835F155|nr:hypothetical protein [Novosphingobium rosa]